MEGTISQTASSSKMMDEEDEDESDISLPESDDSADQAKLKVQNWIRTVNQRASANDDLKDHESARLSTCKLTSEDEPTSNEAEKKETVTATADDEFLDVENGGDDSDHSSDHEHTPL